MKISLSGIDTSRLRAYLSRLGWDTATVVCFLGSVVDTENLRRSLGSRTATRADSLLWCLDQYRKELVVARDRKQADSLRWLGDQLRGIDWR